MNLTHRFSVPASIDDAWAAFSRLDQIAPCFPGAVVGSVTDGEYSGFVKIKFGPVPLVYYGTARYTELNLDARRMVVEARAADRRGSSNATATVTATFTATGNITDIQVLSDLAITGRPAQFGKGVISDVSDKLLDLFLNCASDKFARSAFEAPAAAAATASGDSESEPDSDHGDSETGSTPRPRTSAPPYAYTPPADAAEPDFNVVATVVPVLIKRGWPVLLGLAIGALVVRRILRRRR